MSPIQVNHNISQKNIKPKPSCQLNMKKKVSPSFQTNKRNNKIKSTSSSQSIPTNSLLQKKNNVDNNHNYTPKINNNIMFNTLNLSIKNNNYSIETNPNELKRSGNSNKRVYQKVNIKELENKLTQLEEDKEKLISKVKEQENTIHLLKKERDKLVLQLKEEYQLREKTDEKLDKLMESQNQLILVLKIIELKGVNIDEIIDQWNKDIEEEEQKQLNKNSNTVNSSYVDNDNESYSSIELDSAALIPINLTECEEMPKQSYTYSNIPKLDFDKLKRNKATKKTYENLLNKDNNCNNKIIDIQNIKNSSMSSAKNSRNVSKLSKKNQQHNMKDSNRHNRLKSAILGNNKEVKSSIEIIANKNLNKKKKCITVNLNSKKDK